jgi:hypothetical protein
MIAFNRNIVERPGAGVAVAATCPAFHLCDRTDPRSARQGIDHERESGTV